MSENDSKAAVHAFPGDFAGQRGMTLRDYFAGQALVGTLAGRSVPWPADDAAREAYEIADAMLKARSQ